MLGLRGGDGAAGAHGPGLPPVPIAEHVFQAHGADATGRMVFRKRITQAKLLAFSAAQPPRVVALEACGGRTIGPANSGSRTIPSD